MTQHRKRLPVRAFTFVLVSAIALLPCLWLPKIEAGDLGSHSYNAWLTSLVLQGKAPGLWVAGQNSNILFDVLLLRLGSMFGFAEGEKAAVCIAVLVFLWGAFALVSAAQGGPGWHLMPILMTLAYGWTWQMGFFNFYLSMGLAFAALALFWRVRDVRSLYAIFLLPLIWLAHPMGLFWLAAMAAYIFLARKLSPGYQLILAAACLACVLAGHLYVSQHYRVQRWQGRFIDLLGTDQLVLGTRYQFIIALILFTVLGCTAIHLLRNRQAGANLKLSVPLPFQLYAVMALSLLLIPDVIWLPQYDEPISMICSRFTLAVAVIGCCTLSALRPKGLFFVLTAAVAVVYFVFVYQDAAKTYALERQADFLVARVPRGARVISTIYPFRGSRVFVHHVVDRACIGHCFDIDNYEVPSKAFRLRGTFGNRFVTTSMDDANSMMLGEYVVRPDDLPVWHIFQCGPAEVDLCLRPLYPGPLRNVSPVGLQRARDPFSHPDGNQTHEGPRGN